MNDRDDPEWQARFDALLDAALTMRPDEREAFLDRQSGTEAGMVGEVRALLAAAGSGDALDGPVARSLRTAPVAALPHGTLVGTWRLLELVGRGGMGEVYRAERTDGAFEQQVAIKLIRPEAIDHLRRFHDERRVLARLDHPGIAR
ncbi:MAG TPA: hypothetical protein VJM11_13570, partial [Nevskiaceae bacterium]|nr:hypothetical protein [Nevskiaceae bacterium]